MNALRTKQALRNVRDDQSVKTRYTTVHGIATEHETTTAAETARMGTEGMEMETTPVEMPLRMFRRMTRD